MLRHCVLLPAGFALGLGLRAEDPKPATSPAPQSPADPFGALLAGLSRAMLGFWTCMPMPMLKNAFARDLSLRTSIEM